MLEGDVGLTGLEGEPPKPDPDPEPKPDPLLDPKPDPPLDPKPDPLLDPKPDPLPDPKALPLPLPKPEPEAPFVPVVVPFRLPPPTAPPATFCVGSNTNSH